MKDGIYHVRFSSNMQGVGEVSPYSKGRASMVATPATHIQDLSRAMTPDLPPS